MFLEPPCFVASVRAHLVAGDRINGKKALRFALSDITRARVYGRRVQRATGGSRACQPKAFAAFRPGRGSVSITKTTPKSAPTSDVVVDPPRACRADHHEYAT